MKEKTILIPRQRVIRGKIIFVTVVVLIIFLTAVHLRGVSREVIRIRDATQTPFSVMIDDVSSARVVYIGESHDNVHHHESQLEIIQSLHDKGRSLTIGLEMFKREDQKILDHWVAGGMDEKEFRRYFLNNWGFGWELYRGIFLYGRDHAIPMIGLNVPRRITKKVAQGGFGSLTMDERAQLPPSVTCDVDPRYMDHLKLVFRYKGKTDRSFVNFCEAQVLWDQAMAWYLAQYLEKNPDRVVVVLAGSVHSWKFGIPRQLGRLSSVKQMIILPETPTGSRYISTEDADYLLLHG